MRVAIQFACDGLNCEATGTGSGALNQQTTGGPYVVSSDDVTLPEGWDDRGIGFTGAWIGREWGMAFCPECKR